MLTSKHFKKATQLLGFNFEQLKNFSFDRQFSNEEEEELQRILQQTQQSLIEEEKQKNNKIKNINNDVDKNVQNNNQTNF